VLFLYIALPTQYEYIYPYYFTSPSPRYLNPYSIVSLKYLSTCFATIQRSCLDSTMNWLKVFIAKHISDLMLTKYIKEHISFLYDVGSTISKSEVVTFFKLVIVDTLFHPPIWVDHGSMKKVIIQGVMAQIVTWKTPHRLGCDLEHGISTVISMNAWAKTLRIY